jgi:hypothetical protein
MAGIFNSSIFNNAIFNTGADGPTPTPGREGLGGDDIPYRRNPNKGWDKEAYDKKRADEASMVETLKGAYARLTGQDSPVSVLAQADAIVRPHAEQSEEAPLRIDWKAIARSQERAVALLRLYEEERELQRASDDEDDLIMLLH